MATIGNTDDSGFPSNITVGSQRYIDDGHTAVEDGTIDSITLMTLLNCTEAGNAQRLCLYVGAGADADTVLANSDTGERLADSSEARVGGGYVCTWNYTGSKPTLSSGTTYGLSCTTGDTRPYYQTTGGAVRAYNGVGTATAPADPAGTPDATNAFIILIYATYTAGSFDGVARRLGLSVGIGL